jgi:hypothetical protein
MRTGMQSGPRQTRWPLSCFGAALTPARLAGSPAVCTTSRPASAAAARSGSGSYALTLVAPAAAWYDDHDALPRLVARWPPGARTGAGVTTIHSLPSPTNSLSSYQIPRGGGQAARSLQVTSVTATNITIGAPRRYGLPLCLHRGPPRLRPSSRRAPARDDPAPGREP